jgi:class 3 adenylate cyclase/tetratricopeptide (TPR) repeat protein
VEAATTDVVFEDQGELLKPYVPRLLIEWVQTAPEIHVHAREGTLAFVDISGFTALTERLASRGKIGAEVLRDTLDGVFKALLDEAYAWGAGLLKWGGDALLLLFDDAAHPERAARAAWEMQRTIERVGRIRVGSDVVTLRMSIGIASGKIDFFTAGSQHRELLVAGPVATETVLMEGIADAGEIALTPALAELLDPACVGRGKGGARLLSGPPEASAGRSPDVREFAAADVASCIPVAAREHVLLERSEPEHRMITAAFFELMQTDEILARVGPAEFASALDERIRSIEEAAARYQVPFNVTDVSKGAIKVLLSAGAPSSTGHDEEQTLRLVREVMDEAGVIPMRVGVHSGRVFTGDFGPPYRRTYAVLGDAINTAARVMGQAAAGQVLATEEVLGRSRTTFETTPIEPVHVKGKAEPIRPMLVGAITGRREERITDTPFVGRERELATLRTVLADVEAGSGWLVEVGGPSGIGKTRLLSEAFSHTPGVRVLHAMCEEYESSTAYFALREPLRELLGLARGASPAETEQRLREVVADAEPKLAPWVPLLGILLGLDLPPTPESEAIDERFLREVLAEVALRFLVATVSDSPLAIVVEDAQFVDDSSADLLRRLSRSGSSHPYLFVVARTNPQGFWADIADEDVRSLVFDLLPLPKTAAETLVAIATDEQPLRPNEVEELARRSGGSPLFLIELLNVARSTGTTETLPDSIEAVITADIDRLSPADRIALRYASVLGMTFDEELLRAVLEGDVVLDDGVWGRVKGLVDQGADGQRRFRNSLVHDTAYEGLPFRRRRELHGRAAEAIESDAAAVDEGAATLALHFAAARRLERTWHYARVGGDRARAIAAHVEAARLYELALSAGRHVRSVGRRDRADVLIALGYVHETSGHFDDSYEAFRRATVLLRDDPVEQARIYAQRALARQRKGAHSLALRETAAGLRLVGTRQERRAVAVRARLRAWRAEILMFQGHAHESIPIAEAAVKEGKAVDEFDALAHAYTALDGSYALLGQPEKAVHEKLALEKYRQLGNLRLAGIYGFNVGSQAYANGDWDEALRLYLQAREDCLRAGDRDNAAYASACVAELLIGRGELDEAEELLISARRVLRSSDFAVFALFAEIQLARCSLDRGDAETARRALEAVVAEATRVGYAAITLEAGTYLARALAREGAPQDGLEAVAAAVAAAGSDAALYGAAIERARAVCLVALGRRDEALVALEKALASALEQGLLYEQLLIRRARVELTDPGRVQPEELREIERLAQLLGIPS